MSNPAFAILKKAHVTQEDFGRLCDVSRITVNKWINVEGCVPHPGRKTRVANLLKAIKAAHAEGLLPLADYIQDKDARQEAIKKVVVKTLRKITATR